MEVIFLAAGLGSRMGALTLQSPKPLVVFDGRRTILDANIDALQEAVQPARAVVVGGYLWPQIVRFVKRRRASGDVVAVLNPHYANSGPLWSVRLGMEEARGDNIMVANGDTMFLPEAFGRAAKLPEGAWLLVSEEPEPEDDDMMVSLDVAGFVASATKVKGFRRGGLISSGCLILKGKAAADACKQAVSLCLDEEQTLQKSATWHGAVSRMHVLGRAARPVIVDRASWQEFDQPSCIERFMQHYQQDALLPVAV